MAHTSFSAALPLTIPITIPAPVLTPGSSGSFNLGDDQKRWLVTGICLNKILLPTLRDFLTPEMTKHYTHLKTTHNIDKQSHPKQLPKDGKFYLKYGSINNNEANHKKKTHHYDYNVKSEVDLAKLYLQPFMAKFTGFDDTCDLSAVLGILSSASLFSAVVQGLSKDVRQDVRNEWGHCNFVNWNQVKFAKCFQLMDSLLRALNLSPAEEKKITDDLRDWETKGLQLCMGNIVDADLVKFIDVEVAQLYQKVNLLETNQTDEARRVSNGLQSVQEAIEEYKEEIKKALESLKQAQDNTSKKVEELSQDTTAIAEDLESLQIDQQNIKTKVDSIKENQDTLTKRVDEGEEKHASLDKRVEDLETAIETRSTRQANIAFQAPNRIPCFHGRVEELLILAKPLEKKPTPCSMSAVCGLGGTGKTSLALEHIWKNKEVYSGGVFWISGESNSLFRISMSEMARQIGTFDEDFAMLLSKTLDWLQTRKEYWCLVIDNLDEFKLSTEILKLLCGRWKRQAAGHILITTRRENNLLKEKIPDISEDCIELENLSETESVEFIKIRTSRTGTSDDAVIRELVVELGTLPLALDQAAAFIKNMTEISFSQYLEQYKKNKLNTLKRFEAYFPTPDTSGDQDRIAVHTTWQLNFDYVSRLSEECGIGQAAALIMEVSAFLSPDDIPQEIINQGLPQVNNEDLLSCLSTPIGAADIMSVLTKFSLFQTFTDKSFSVHRLVQEVIRSRISKDHLKHVLLCASRMLGYAFANTSSPVEVCKSFEGDSVFSQDNPPSLHLWGKLGAHASVLQTYLIQNSQKNDVFRQEILYTEECATILNEASLYLSVCRQKVEAMELQESKLKVLTQLEEPSKEKLDYLKFFDIPLKNVEFKLLSHCMAQQESVLSQDTRRESGSTTCNKTEKANQLREKGNEAVKNQKYEEAIDLYTQAMEFVKDDPRLYNNRALCHLKLGKADEALRDCESCLKLEERNGKALMRKAWALYELSKTQGEKLKGRMRAAAALAAYVDPTATNGKHFKEMFPNPSFRVIRNPTQLAGALMRNISGMTLLIEDGHYELFEAILSEDLQMVALSNDVNLNFVNFSIFQSNFYGEGLVFEKQSGGIKCQENGFLYLYNCQISGGSSGCDDFPDCNGGPGCVAATLAGRNPCDRTGKYGNGISGDTGYPSIQVIESTGHIENCDISESGGGGILCIGDGSSLTVKSCQVHENRQSGVEAREGGRLVAIDNDIYANRFHGIMIGPFPGTCEVVKNRIYENRMEGIIVARTKNNEVILDRNRIFHNLAFGISLDNCQVEIKKNEIFENIFYGIHAKYLTTAIVENNDVFSNKCGGIHIGVNFSGRVYIRLNVVRDNSGPWLQNEDEFILGRPGPMASSDGNSPNYLPEGETKIYSILPLIAQDNDTRNNEEKAFHPKEKIESVQSECAFCRSMENVFRCSKCNIASYCNSTCQKRHWEKHKALCSALTEKYSVTVEPKPHHDLLPEEELLVRAFNQKSEGLGMGPEPDPKSKRRFIVKVQTMTHNGHPLQNLIVYDKSLSIDGSIQSPEVFHVIMECGVLGQINKFTSKKAYFHATFADGGKKLNLYLGQLAPYQDW